MTIIKLDENGTKFSKWVENTIGIEEIACYKQFLLFPHCFQKTCTHKNPGLVGKGLSKLSHIYGSIKIHYAFYQSTESTGRMALKQARSFQPCQTAWTVLAEMYQYFCQMH